MIVENNHRAIHTEINNVKKGQIANGKSLHKSPLGRVLITSSLGIAAVNTQSSTPWIRIWRLVDSTRLVVKTNDPWFRSAAVLFKSLP